MPKVTDFVWFGSDDDKHVCVVTAVETKVNVDKSIYTVFTVFDFKDCKQVSGLSEGDEQQQIKLITQV